MSGDAEPWASVHGLLFPLRTCELEFVSRLSASAPPLAEWLRTNNTGKAFESRRIHAIHFIQISQTRLTLYFRGVNGGRITVGRTVVLFLWLQDIKI